MRVELIYKKLKVLGFTLHNSDSSAKALGVGSHVFLPLFPDTGLSYRGAQAEVHFSVQSKCQRDAKLVQPSVRKRVSPTSASLKHLPANTQASWGA